VKTPATGDIATFWAQ